MRWPGPITASGHLPSCDLPTLSLQDLQAPVSPEVSREGREQRAGPANAETLGCKAKPKDRAFPLSVPWLFLGPPHVSSCP